MTGRGVDDDLNKASSPFSLKDARAIEQQCHVKLASPERPAGLFGKNTLSRSSHRTQQAWFGLGLATAFAITPVIPYALLQSFSEASAMPHGQHILSERRAQRLSPSTATWNPNKDCDYGHDDPESAVQA